MKTAYTDRRQTDRRVSPAIGEYAIQELATLRTENAALAADATAYRYLKANAPPEGITLKFLPNGSQITWGIPYTEAQGDALLDALKRLRRVCESHSWQDLIEDTPEFVALDEARAAIDKAAL